MWCQVPASEPLAQCQSHTTDTGDHINSIYKDCHNQNVKDFIYKMIEICYTNDGEPHMWEERANEQS